MWRDGLAQIALALCIVSGQIQCTDRPRPVSGICCTKPVGGCMCVCIEPVCGGETAVCELYLVYVMGDSSTRQRATLRIDTTRAQPEFI